MLKIKLRDPRTKIRQKTLASLKENMRRDIISAIIGLFILKLSIESNQPFYVVSKLVNIIKTFCEFDDEYVCYLDEIFTVQTADDSGKLTSLLDLSFNNIDSDDLLDEMNDNELDVVQVTNVAEFESVNVANNIVEQNNDKSNINLDNDFDIKESQQTKPVANTSALMVVKKSHTPSKRAHTPIKSHVPKIDGSVKVSKHNQANINKLSVKINESIFITEGDNLQITPIIGGSKQNEQLIYLWEINKKSKWSVYAQQAFPSLVINNVKSSMNMNKLRLTVICDGEQIRSNVCTIAIDKAHLTIKLDENKVMKKDEGIVIIPQMKFKNVDMTQVQFQWYSSQDNGYTWDEIPHQTSDELFLDKVNPVANNQYRLFANYLNKTYKSNIVNVKLSHAIIFIPTEMNVKEQNDLIIDPQITLYNIEPKNVKYQWMYKLHNGDWEKISSSITSANTKKLKIKNIPFTTSGISFKLALITNDGSVFESNECNLTTKQLTPNIKLQIKEEKITVNQHSTLMVDCYVKAQNTINNKIIYNWQVNNGNSFVNIPHQNSSTLIFDNVDLDFNNTQLRLQACVSSSDGEMHYFYSNVISLEIVETVMIDIPVSPQPKITISELIAQDTDTTMKKYFFHNSNEFTKNRSNFTYKIFYYDGSSNGENITRSFVNVKPSDSYQGDLLVRVELYAKPGFVFNNKWTTLISDTMVLCKN